MIEPRSTFGCRFRCTCLANAPDKAGESGPELSYPLCGEICGQASPRSTASNFDAATAVNTILPVRLGTTDSDLEHTFSSAHMSQHAVEIPSSVKKFGFAVKRKCFETKPPTKLADDPTTPAFPFTPQTGPANMIHNGEQG